MISGIQRLIGAVVKLMQLWIEATTWRIKNRKDNLEVLIWTIHARE